MIIAFLFGVIGLLLAKLFSGKTEGEKGLIPSIILRKTISKYKIVIHFHHWLFSLIIILVLVLLFNYVFDISLYLLISFFIGIMIQGLMYKDRFDVVKLKRLSKD